MPRGIIITGITVTVDILADMKKARASGPFLLIGLTHAGLKHAKSGTAGDVVA
jgi:hypothetical protein